MRDNGDRALYEEKSRELLLPIVRERNIELVDIEYVKEAQERYLRAYIDKPGGVTIDDCEDVSRAFSDRLDEEDFISDSYILEVSSPGLGRPLKKENDFKRSVGQKIEIKAYRPIDGKKEMTGILESFDKDTLTLRREEGGLLTLSRKDLALVRLAFDF